MGRIPQQKVEQVLAATDIVSVIGSYLPLQRAGVVHKALCPFHSDETPSFIVNPRRQTFLCFGCGKSGDAITFVREHKNLSFSDAIKELATRAGIPLEGE